MNKIIQWVIGAVAVIALILGLVGNNQSAVSTEILGAAGTRFPNGVSVNSTTAPTGKGLIIGQNGSENIEMKSGTCTLTNYSTAGQGIDASQAASSTVVYQCPVTGVASGDITLVQLATSTAMFVNGWSVVGSTASSTAGYINVLISNLTGTARVPSVSGVGSSTNYWYVDTN